MSYDDKSVLPEKYKQAIKTSMLCLFIARQNTAIVERNSDGNECVGCIVCQRQWCSRSSRLRRQR